MILKTKPFKVFFLLLTVFIFSCSKGSLANAFESGKEETNVGAASNVPAGQLLLSTPSGVPAVCLTKSENLPGAGIYSKDFHQPPHSFSHLKKSFLKIVSSRSFVMAKQSIRLHLACCVLLI